ncbi:MAG: cupin-like domain-containing protein [Gammaproteobacteria bacterium]
MKNPVPAEDYSKLVDWRAELATKCATESVVASHQIHELDIFRSDALIDLIDRYPRERLQVFTMGNDPLDRSQWQPVDTTGTSGADIMHAVKVGRLWVKLMRIDLFEDRFRDLVSGLHEEIGRRCPELSPLWLRPLLLISSPRALVYYHADPQPTMLWQVSGSKRVWIYPAGDHALLRPDLLEQIYAGEIDEEAPYEPEFDRYALVHDLTPGDLLAWPLNAPHRVSNHDSVNVSLSVPYGTHQAERRSQVYQANLYLRRRFRLRNLSTSEKGVGSFIKRNSFRVARRLGLTPAAGSTRDAYMANVRIDVSSPAGISRIPGDPVPTPF